MTNNQTKPWETCLIKIILYKMTNNQTKPWETCLIKIILYKMTNNQTKPNQTMRNLSNQNYFIQNDK